MKKIVAFLSTILLGVSLSACGKVEEKKEEGKDTQATQTQANAGEQSQTQANAGGQPQNQSQQ